MYFQAKRALIGKTKKRSCCKYRNVPLIYDRYGKLDKYLIELIQKKGDRHISLDEAIKSELIHTIQLKLKKEVD